jgi:hypothetical protein
MRCATALVLAMGVVGWAPAPADAQKGGRGGPNAFAHGWLASLEEGKAQACKTGKLLMVVVRCVP